MNSFLSEIEDAGDIPIPSGKLAYFQARLKNKLYTHVLKKFLEKEENDGLTKAKLARRIGKKPEVVNRLLGAPGNWTLETVSDLLIGIAAEELEPRSTPVAGRPDRNYALPFWATSAIEEDQVTNQSTQNPLEKTRSEPATRKAPSTRPAEMSLRRDGAPSNRAERMANQ
ncbi:hypothetical protein [Inquilinus sp. OTU3971]|uniref:hypothetical protein n=1 Tax=Inquilinus sp. OTU3971 TaxID=3043855 RepID=UPI00313BD82A